MAISGPNREQIVVREHPENCTYGTLVHVSHAAPEGTKRSGQKALTNSILLNVGTKDKGHKEESILVAGGLRRSARLHSELSTTKGSSHTRANGSHVKCGTWP